MFKGLKQRMDSVGTFLGECLRMVTSRTGWRQLLAAAVIFAVVGGTGALLFVWAGLVPIAASSGHWPITHDLLAFAMRNAVETQAMGRPLPPLEDPAAVALGARHYAGQCAVCHGAPDEPPSVTMQQMTPQPPRLPEELRPWTRQELFWIVRNGIKFTAMPAWPALEREDEIWAMVAFLRRLPTLDAAAYQALVREERSADAPGVMPGAGHSAAAACENCHGPADNYRERGPVPRLAGQTREYLRASLRAYATGTRHSGIMQPVAAALDNNTIEWLATYYASAAVIDVPEAEVQSAANVERGASLARDGSPALGVPSCVECHGPGEASRNPAYPLLAGQPAPYLTTQLRLLRDGKRGGTAYAPIMMQIAHRLDDAEIAALAAYYANAAGREETYQ